MVVRPIDSEKYMELLKEQYLHNQSMGNSQAARAWQGAIQLLYDMPTLTPPNEPLPVLVNAETDREYIDYICPRCKEIISQRRRGQRMETVYQCKYHDNCGQCVDWSDPQPYRRPPEGEEGDADRG